MRHRIRKAKLGRTTEHRKALLANLVCSLIKHRRIKTTLAKAKAARVVADKMVTLGKKGQDEKSALKYRSLIAARLQSQPRRFFPKKNSVPGRERRKIWTEHEDVVRILVEDIAPGFADRNGGYTRVIRLGRRRGDAAEMAFLEWVSEEVEADTTEQPEPKQKQAKPEPKTEETQEEETAETATEEETDEVEDAGEETEESKESAEAEEETAETEEETAETEEEPEAKKDDPDDKPGK